MASIMRMPFMLVFHQSKCSSATECIRFLLLPRVCLQVQNVFVCFLSLRCMLIPRALRVGVKKSYTINHSGTATSNG